MECDFCGSELTEDETFLIGYLEIPETDLRLCAGCDDADADADA